MDIERFIQTSLQTQLLGKKLKINKSLISSVSFEDQGGPYHCDYKILLITEDSRAFIYELYENIELVDN